MAAASLKTANKPPVCTWRARGTSRQAAQLVRSIIANHDQQARTAHDIAADTEDRGQLPERVRRLLDRRAGAVQRRRAAYRHCQEETQGLLAERQRGLEQHIEPRL